MGEEVQADQPITLSRKAKTKLEKQTEHIERIKRTVVACMIGIIIGVASFYMSGFAAKDIGLLAFMLMLAGIVIQRHIFILLKMTNTKLGAKDWFYQGFMTFAFWFMSWTILLSSPHL
jgi:hypothetical protein